MFLDSNTRVTWRMCIVMMITIIAFPAWGYAQQDKPLSTLPLHQIPLNNKDAFSKSGSNWEVAGGVKSNRLKDQDLHALSGTGILVNNPTSAHHQHLVTNMQHGDLELELDFLMAKGSNSGVYLQGRYEVQLLDSWDVDNPKFSDCGGIYQRWDDSKPEGQRGYQGHAPSMNASRAPGLWQHLKVIFKAPEFDANGNKTSNAKFKKVWLNGVLVQENVEVTGPTRAAMFNDEKPMGPLVIQGDHGPVAVRNIRYKKYDKNHITLKNLHYDFYKGPQKMIPNTDTMQVAASGQVDSLIDDVGQDAERYFLHYTGTLEAPNAGEYLFKVRAAGMIQINIDGKTVIKQTDFHNMGEYDSGTINLDKGEHKFALSLVDHPISWLHGLALYGEGPQLRMQPFHSMKSLPNRGKETPPLIVKPEKRVKAIRSFGMFGDVKRTDVMNVGSPDGVNYNYDVEQGELLHVWNGPYIDTHEMWVNRGEPQLATPFGSVVKLDGEPPLAHLNNDNQAWPDSIAWNQMHVKGYNLIENGWPEFRYAVGDVNVHDYLSGHANDRRIIRKVWMEAPNRENGLWYHLASGKSIRKNSNDEYVVNDRSYYLKIMESGGGKPVIRDTAQGQELLVPVLSDTKTTTVRYALIW